MYLKSLVLVVSLLVANSLFAKDGRLLTLDFGTVHPGVDYGTEMHIIDGGPVSVGSIRVSFQSNSHCRIESLDLTYENAHGRIFVLQASTNGLFSVNDSVRRLEYGFRVVSNSCSFINIIIDRISSVSPVNPLPSKGWMSDARFTSMDASFFLSETKESTGYELLVPRAQEFKNSIKRLINAGEDAVPESLFPQFFRSVQSSFHALASTYYEIQPEINNDKVARHWRSLVDSMKRLESHF